MARYRQVSLLGCLPRAGGLRDQNTLELVLFTELRRLEREHEQKQRTELAQTDPLGAILAMAASRR